MLTTRVIPCLDIDAGRVVKGVRFQNLRDAGDPTDLAASYERQGADEIVILDVSASVEGRNACVETVRSVRARLSIPLTVGGGVADPAHAERLLNAGADRVAVNTAAVRRPELVTQLSDRFGVQCVVVAIDAARRENTDAWQVVTLGGRRWEPLSVPEWAQRCETLGAGEILLTSWDRDGAGLGYDLELIEGVRSACRTPIIASGGARTPEHLMDAINAGASAVLAASIFHDDQETVGDVKRRLAALGARVRT